MKKLFAGLLALMLAAIPAVSLASYGGSSSIGSSLKRDNCPNGDYSVSYYDGTCDDESESEDDESGVTLDGYIFFDDDQDGFFDDDEDGVQGAIVTLKTLSNSILDTDVTSSAGYYAFYNVQPGTYKIHVSIPAQLTVLESILAILAPSVHAQSDYEFVVVVEEDDEWTKTVGSTPVVDGSVVTTVEAEADEDDEEDMVEEESIDDILDLIEEMNDDASDLDETVGDDSWEEQVELPEFLPQTGASL